MSTHQFLPLANYKQYPEHIMRRRAKTFYEEISGRRTVRDFSSQPIPLSVIEHCLRTAGTAPSGANLQPWHFVVVTDSTMKAQIREGAEEEERTFYSGRAPREWLDALAPLGTNEHKPFLETAPCLIAIFAETHGLLPDGRKVKHYYVQESVGIATGLLITAIHHAGLVSLTHTPSPMKFLNKILKRPIHERPFLLLVVGYPAEGTTVPTITKKPLDDFVTFT